MRKLTNILKQHDIDTASLSPLADRGDETVVVLQTTGQLALELWSKLRSIVGETGYWPVILGDEIDLGHFKDNFRWPDYKRPSAVHILSIKIDPLDWFRSEHEEDLSHAEDMVGLHGKWPDNVKPSNHILAPYDVRTKAPLPTLYIALAPTQNSWEAPAYLRFGGWNACPQPEVHVSMLRRWHNIYGAELVTMTSDTLEFELGKPPRDRESALQLAEEQYIYCNDIVWQGTQTLEALAATLLNSTVWFFWWD